MPIPVDYFQPESFQQANPLLSGIQAGQQIFGQGVQNHYLAPTLAQQLQQLQLANQKAQAVLPYAAPQAAAQVGLTQAQTGAENALPGYYGAMSNEANARGNLFGAQANLTTQQTPYLVEQAQIGAYPDAIMSRGVQLQNAQRTGAISPSYLSYLGLGNSQNGNGQIPMGTNNLQNQAQLLRSTNQPAMTIQAGGIPMTPQQQKTLAMLRQGIQNGQEQGTIPNYNVPSNGIPQTNFPQSNSMPGVGNNPLQNYALFGSPISPIAMMQLQALGKGFDTQATTGVTQYNDAQQEASKDANLGTQTAQLVDQFQNAYNNSKYKGSALGTVPVTGMHTLLMGDVSNEQKADNASQNIAAMVAKMIAGGRVTNYEMQYINNLKPNRAMEPATAQMASDFLKQKSLRMGEQQDFLNTARNQGIDVQTANTLWNQYNNQRPVYNFSTKQSNTGFQKSWSDYLTPDAVNAARTGQNYVPLPSFNSKQDFQNWYKTISPGDQATVKNELGRQQ